MTTWYRVSQSPETEITFSGEGGLHVEGRWNKIGKKIIYCSASIALCTLEWLSHNGLSVSGFNYFRFSIDVPDNLIRKFSVSNLPQDWNLTPATNGTRDFAEDHLFSSDKTLAIAVPSVIVPEEYNLVINPAHTAFRHVVKTVQNLGQFIAPRRERS